MHFESRAMQAAMFTLKHHGIASFTVHDSLIVPRSAVSLTIQCLADEYHQAAGTEEIALVVHSAAEPDRHVVARRQIKDWELEDGASGDPWLTGPAADADSEHSFGEPD